MALGDTQCGVRSVIFVEIKDSSFFNLDLEIVFTCREMCSKSCQNKKRCWNDKFSPSGLKDIEIILVNHFYISGTFYCLKSLFHYLEHY